MHEATNIPPGDFAVTGLVILGPGFVLVWAMWLLPLVSFLRKAPDRHWRLVAKRGLLVFAVVFGLCAPAGMVALSLVWYHIVPPLPPQAVVAAGVALGPGCVLLFRGLCGRAEAAVVMHCGLRAILGSAEEVAKCVAETSRRARAMPTRWWEWPVIGLMFAICLLIVWFYSGAAI